MENNCSKCGKEFDGYCEDDKCPAMGYVDYSGTCGEYLTEDEE